jgi:hypothetical protein
MWSNDDEKSYPSLESKHPLYKTYYSVNHIKFAPDSYFSKLKEEKLILFVVVGNFGSYI